MIKDYSTRLRKPKDIPVHSPKDLAHMLWTKYMRPLEAPTHEGFDIPIVFTGRPGNGKSEAALATIFELNKLSGAPFDFHKQVVYNEKQFVEAVDSLPKYACILIDEAISLLFARSDNSLVVKYINACRSKHLGLFYAIPNFSDMDSKARNGNIRYWIHVQEPGKGLEFMPDEALTSKSQNLDPWCEWAFRLIRQGKIGVERHPCFMGVFKWEQIDKKQRALYVEWKNRESLMAIAERQKEEKLTIESSNRLEPFFVWLDENGFGYRGIKKRAAEYLGVAPATITQRVDKIKQEKRVI